MTDPTDPSSLFTARNEAVGRRRTAPRTEQTSDVHRFSGVWVASVVAAIAVLVAAVLTVDPQQARSPGPLSLPHASAKLDCASCHVDAERPAAAACVGCHGERASVRRGHRSLATAGTLRCVDCHAVHQDLGGVEFLPSGTITRFGPGAAQVLEPDALGHGIEVEVEARTRVPLVPVGHCARCHEPSSAQDPIARCVLADQASLGGERPTVCFDEHQSFRGTAFDDGEQLYERTRVWAAAREVAAAAPRTPRVPAPERNPWWWLAFGGVAGVVAFIVVRVVRRVGRRRSTVSATVSVEPPKVRRLPQINTATCIGCHACVDACPYDVLEVRSFVAHVVRPDDCCGLTLCEQRCPNGSLVITDGDPIEDRPRVDEALQSIDTPGLYVAGDLTGLPLIRNAINQGAIAARAAAQSLRERGRTGDASMIDVAIVGSGPAGLSASLAAAEAGLSYVTIEQGSVAQSVRSFPRGKLVFDQPLGLPLEGDLWLQESTKEELLGQWRRIIAARRLNIEEHAQVTAVTPHAGGFEVLASREGHALRWHARRVILALGRRGTPRRLAVPIADALASRVHYSLADARSFAGARVLVVGLGDVAMEAAIGLARQPGTTVTVSYRGDGFRRGKGRNIEQVKRLAASGRISLQLGTEVDAIEPGEVTLRGAQGTIAVPWDAMFVMIGSMAPWPFLDAAGVRRGAAVASSPAAHDGHQSAS